MSQLGNLTLLVEGVGELVGATAKYTGDHVDEVLITVSLLTTFFGFVQSNHDQYHRVHAALNVMDVGLFTVLDAVEVLRRVCAPDE